MLDLTLRGGDVVGKLEETGNRITETIVTRGGKVTDTFREARRRRSRARSTPSGDSVREMLGSRLQSFEEMFTHGGSELAEKISRDSSSLGSLITQHLAEFDRTVKVYGGELVERLGQRTVEVTDGMRNSRRQLREPRRRPHQRSRDRHGRAHQSPRRGPRRPHPAPSTTRSARA